MYICCWLWNSGIPGKVFPLMRFWCKNLPICDKITRVSTRLEKLENRPYFDFRLEKLGNSIDSHPTDWKNWKKKNGPMVQIFFFKLPGSCAQFEIPTTPTPCPIPKSKDYTSSTQNKMRAYRYCIDGNCVINITLYKGIWDLVHIKNNSLEQLKTWLLIS